MDAVMIGLLWPTLVDVIGEEPTVERQTIPLSAIARRAASGMAMLNIYISPGHDMILKIIADLGGPLVLPIHAGLV